tara:strand:+ start:454 stop:639 length:186 start_codon:yes stop_codon:yes gene_type:complete
MMMMMMMKKATLSLSLSLDDDDDPTMETRAYRSSALLYSLSSIVVQPQQQPFSKRPQNSFF